eukprot:462969-Lingulodinium_polyedra.AAC.1
MRPAREVFIGRMPARLSEAKGTHPLGPRRAMEGRPRVAVGADMFRKATGISIACRNPPPDH